MTTKTQTELLEVGQVWKTKKGTEYKVVSVSGLFAVLQNTATRKITQRWRHETNNLIQVG